MVFKRCCSFLVRRRFIPVSHMPKVMIISIACVFTASVFLLFSGYAEDIKSPFNSLTLSINKNVGDHSFFVAGKIFGSVYDCSTSVFPAPSVIASIDIVNSSSVDFFVSLGDIYGRPSLLNIQNFNKSFASKINMPFFNSPGNHEMENRALYEYYYGKETYFDFIYGQEAFIFLDTDLDKGIEGEQLKYFQRILHDYTKDPSIKNVFIFGHELLWSAYNVNFQFIFSFLITKRHYPLTSGNFKCEIEPYLINLSQKGKDIYWFSGDGGGAFPCVFFYAKDPHHNIRYIATGIQDNINDAIIKVNINKSGEVTMEPISLTGKKLLPIESYSLNYWENLINK